MSKRSFDIREYTSTRQPDGSYINDMGTIHWYNTTADIHKEDGPAVIYANGTSGWFFKGEHYSFNEWLKRTPIPDEQKLLLRLQYD